MTGQIKSLNSVWSEKNSNSDLFLKTVLFSVWVPNSEERKSNPRNPYLRMLVRIAESLYSRGSVPISGSMSVYAGSGLASNSASGSESTISPVRNFKLSVY
jgi:hypothetical protein